MPETVSTRIDFLNCLFDLLDLRVRLCDGLGREESSLVLHLGGCRGDAGDAKATTREQRQKPGETQHGSISRADPRDSEKQHQKTVAGACLRQFVTTLDAERGLLGDRKAGALPFLGTDFGHRHTKRKAPARALASALG